MTILDNVRIAYYTLESLMNDYSYLTTFRFKSIQDYDDFQKKISDMATSPTIINGEYKE